MITDTFFTRQQVEDAIKESAKRQFAKDIENAKTLYCIVQCGKDARHMCPYVYKDNVGCANYIKFSNELEKM